MTLRRPALLLVALAAVLALAFATIGCGGTEEQTAAVIDDGSATSDEPAVSSQAPDLSNEIELPIEDGDVPAPAEDNAEAAVEEESEEPAQDKKKKKKKNKAAQAAANAYPVRVRIPDIGVDATVIDLGLNNDGTLEVPTDYSETGWYTGRSAPGNVGPSVVVGHVDSKTGPAVFFRLRELEAGDLIAIDRSDGLVAWFRTTKIVLVNKDEFPTNKVYGPTEQPTLRLITCGGDFDQSARSYVGNTIVYAEHLGNLQPGEDVQI